MNHRRARLRVGLARAIMGNMRGKALLASLALVSLLLAVGCKDKPLPGATVAIVGIDGGDWDVFDQLIAEGRLPNLQKMRTQGATARLDIESALSPESWTSLATGQPPEVHGIVQADSPGGIGFFAHPEQLNVKRLWDMAGDCDKRSLVVDYWVTEPAYPINGVLIAREGNSAYPADARSDQGTPLDPLQELDNAHALGLTAPRSGNMLAWMAKGQFDLLVLPIYAHDQAMHQLWSEYETRIDGVSDEAMAAVGPGTAERVRAGYEIVAQTAMIGDRLMGKAMEYVGETGYVMLVSDHGHERSSPPVRRISISRTILDGNQGTVERGTYTVKTPTGTANAVLTSRKKNGNVAVDSLDYELHYPEIRLTGQAADAARARLLLLTTADGAPLLAQGPGETLVPSDAVFAAARTSLGSREENGYSIFVNSGSHGLDDLGVFGLYGPGVVQGELPRAVDSVDATPTALWLLGCPVPEDLIGEPATFALDETSRNDRPVRTVATYEDDTRPWAGGGPRHISQEERERLKALGYIE